MNATLAIARTGMPGASSPLPLRVVPAVPAAAQRLSVWDERARKMGYPPSAR